MKRSSKNYWVGGTDAQTDGPTFIIEVLVGLKRTKENACKTLKDVHVTYLQESFDGRYDLVFKRLDEQPVGSGCCAQVRELVLKMYNYRG